MDINTLHDHFDLEDKGSRWTVWCKVCDSGWSMSKKPTQASLHTLDHHAMTHEENRKKRASTTKRNEGVSAVKNFYAGLTGRGDDTVAKKALSAGSSFTALDKLVNLQARLYKKGDKAGVRKTSGGRQDEITEKMAGLTTPSEIAQFASEFSVPTEVIVTRAKTAPNFGQFRMLMGNLARGVLNRYQKAQGSAELKGKVSLVDCGTLESFTAKVRSLAPTKEPKAKPVKAAKPGTVEKEASGGAKSKQEQAKSGKGKKAKAAPRKRGEIKVVEGDDDVPLAPDAVADESVA